MDKESTSHVHLVDKPTENGIKTWKPVSIADDSNQDRFRIRSGTSIGETNGFYSSMLRRPAPRKTMY